MALQPHPVDSSANTFRRDIELRYGTCVVTRNPVSLVASHLVPKHVGDEGAEAIMERFVGEGDLKQFFWKFNNADAIGRGHDPTVTPF